jgi:hypothetical protein
MELSRYKSAPFTFIKCYTIINKSCVTITFLLKQELFQTSMSREANTKEAVFYFDKTIKTKHKKRAKFKK